MGTGDYQEASLSSSVVPPPPPPPPPVPSQPPWLDTMDEQQEGLLVVASPGSVQEHHHLGREQVRGHLYPMQEQLRRQIPQSQLAASKGSTTSSSGTPRLPTPTVAQTVQTLQSEYQQSSPHKIVPPRNRDRENPVTLFNRYHSKGPQIVPPPPPMLHDTPPNFPNHVENSWQSEHIWFVDGRRLMPPPPPP